MPARFLTTRRSRPTSPRSTTTIGTPLPPRIQQEPVRAWQRTTRKHRPDSSAYLSPPSSRTVCNVGARLMAGWQDASDHEWERNRGPARFHAALPSGGYDANDRASHRVSDEEHPAVDQPNSIEAQFIVGTGQLITTRFRIGTPARVRPLFARKRGRSETRSPRPP
jgi:hypothetical protein